MGWAKWSLASFTIVIKRGTFLRWRLVMYVADNNNRSDFYDTSLKVSYLLHSQGWSPSLYLETGLSD
jgi:hypothetical protein